jgi:hypothetical protein
LLFMGFQSIRGIPSETRGEDSTVLAGHVV